MNTNSPSLTDYLRLFRLPNVFTAIADVTMGFLFVHRGLHPAGVYLCLAAASALMYTAGMVLNDVWDADQDLRERPDRPIPAGRIARATARRVGFALLASGVAAGWLAGYLGLVAGAVAWRAGAVATLLAACVLLYDTLLKGTALGPLAMGGCRFFNVLLGMAVAVPCVGPGAVAGYGLHHLLAAGGIGLYIAGVTWFAKTEASVSRRLPLAFGTAVMMSGIALLAMVYHHLPMDLPKTLRHESTWILLLGLLAFTISRRCVIAVADPTAQRVQMAVKNGIWSLIVLDAAVALLVSTPVWAMAVLVLLVPTVVLGMRLPAT